MTPTGAPTVASLLDLSGETVLVTGASGNIGQSIATRLAEAGATIVAHYHRNAAAARALVENIGGGEVIATDLLDKHAVDEMIANVRPTMLVNNAAKQDVRPLCEMALSDWQAMMAVNVDAAFLLTQRVASIWSKNGKGGAVVNIGSIEGLDPAAGHGHYATSKAALLMMTRAAALEYGAQNIRVNSVSPGLIERAELHQDWPEGVQRWLDRAPLTRIGTPNDVADAVLFLLSPAARWISGENLIVDGGMSAQNRW